MPITKQERDALLGKHEWPSPVQYLPNPEHTAPPEQGSGYTTPGWYFWEENWAYCQGPYETKEQADEACTKYAATL